MTVTKKAAPEAIYAEAMAAATAAVKACTPTPMIVGEAKAVFGPGANDIDYSQPTYFVEGGVCGFGYVRIRPARGAFVQYLKKRGIGYNGYYGGWEISASKFAGGIGQSYERAMAAANAAARVLNGYGITAYADGRLD